MKRSELGCKSNLLLWAESGLIAEKKDRVFLEPVPVP